MRVLAIRGKNLASLAGEFDVDLQHGPLGRAGLFAITGRTGSGKSTLLDAMCLALFARTPRLSAARSKAKIGGDGPDAEISAGNPLRLLRRGTGEGYAEVDFVGNTGRWRARWSARRAYGDPKQRLQHAEMQLLNLHDMRSVGDTKTDVLQRIESELGLTYDQFTRSVLLAQGEFAAFLKATSADRAALLEKMTGTSLYAELSRRCHEISRDHNAALEALRRGSSDIRLLGEAEREDIEAKAAEIEARRGQLRSEHDALSALVSWLELVDNDRQQLLRHRVQLDEQRQGVQERRARIDALRAMLVLLPLRAAVERALTDEAEAQRRGVEADASHQAAQAHLTKAQSTVEGLDTQQRELSQRIESLRPAMDAARRLDGQVLAASAELRRIDSTLATRDLTIQQRSEHMDRERKAATERLAAATAHEGWLQDHPTASRLARDWGESRLALMRLAALAGDRAQERAELVSEVGAIELLTTQIEQLDVRLAAGTSALEAAPDVETIRAAEALVSNTRQALVLAEEVARLSLELEQISGRESIAAAERQEHLAKAAAASQALDEIATEEPAAAARAAEATGALERVAATRDLSDHRHLLEDGEPCPLCGSREHPEAPHPLDGLHRETKARATELQTNLQQLQGRRERLLADRDASTRAAELATHRSQLEVGRKTEIEGKLAAGKEALGSDTVGTCGGRLQEAEARLSILQEADRAASKQREVLASVTAALEGAHATRERRRAAEQSHRDKLDRTDTAIATLRTALAPALSSEGWPDESELEAFATGWLEAGEAAAERSEAVRGERAQADEIDASLRETAAVLQTERAERQEQARRRDAAAAELEGLRAARQEVLDQPDVDALQASLDAESHRLGEAIRMARAAAAQFQADAQATRLLQQSATDAMRASQLARVTAAEQFEARRILHDVPLPADVTEPVLRDELGQLEAHEELTRSLTERIGVLEEQLALRELAAPTTGPLPSTAEAKASLEAASGALETLTQAWSEHKAVLGADVAARASHRELQSRLDEQTTTTRRWAQLHELIGSHDGSKLRKFAQSLTLDALLSHANAHLTDLAPRYRLARTPGEDLELQVIDREMGDDVRPVASLSGGESFLASLALALGLSSLAARDVRIDSLFIDEGFGTLDQQTLQLVLDTLDTLQATGRQVGVISHVAGIAERVGFRVEVKSRGQGKSTVRTTGLA